MSQLFLTVDLLPIINSMSRHCMLVIRRGWFLFGIERNFLHQKDALTPDFFVLSTRIAGEILQKFINYQFKFAIVGDFSGYTSKPLKDFIYESNKGRDIFFVSSEEDAIEKLSRT